MQHGHFSILCSNEIVFIILVFIDSFSAETVHINIMYTLKFYCVIKIMSRFELFQDWGHVVWLLIMTLAVIRNCASSVVSGFIMWNHAGRLFFSPCCCPTRRLCRAWLATGKWVSCLVILIACSSFSLCAFPLIFLSLPQSRRHYRRGRGDLKYLIPIPGKPWGGLHQHGSLSCFTLSQTERREKSY